MCHSKERSAAMAQDSLRRRKRERRVRAALATTGGPRRISAAAEFADFLSDVRRGVVQGVRATSRQAPTCFPSSPDMLPVQPRHASCQAPTCFLSRNPASGILRYRRVLCHVRALHLAGYASRHASCRETQLLASPISTCSMSCSRSSSGWVRAVAAPSQMALRRQA